MRTFGILAGFWSTNIGNAFFQLGAQHLLSKLFPADRQVLLADQPGYAFPSSGNPVNAFDLVAATPMDYLVITGPFLRPEFHQILLPTMERLAAKGTRFICLGIGMMHYGDDTVRETRKALEKLPIDVFTTRDRPTYEKFRDIAQQTYDGIDLAFYVNELWDSSVGLDIGPYAVLNFDQTPEPDFRKVNTTEPGAVSIGDGSYSLSFPAFRQQVASKGAAFQIVERLFSRSQATADLGGLKILRTDHRYNPILRRKVFAYPETVSLDIPWPYLQVYSNAEIVLSNRVHACVATLAFGGKAMLFSKSPRAHLLDRLGLTEVKREPARLDPEQLNQEKRLLEAFLGAALAAS